jgi:hypothetical protein
MKKLICTLLTAGFTAIASAGTTNAVQHINIALTFTSQLGTNYTYFTNITHTGVGAGRVFTTNIITNVAYTVSHKSIVTKDVIASLLGLPSAPAGAALVRVQNGTNSSSIQVRYAGNHVTVTNLTGGQIGNFVAKATKLTDGVVIPGSGTDFALKQYVLDLTAGSPLSFTLWGATETTHVSAHLGKYTTVVDESTADVVGYGSDAIGTNEIVTGTISANGTVLEVD